jgi:hypothetical protein
MSTGFKVLGAENGWRHNIWLSDINENIEINRKSGFRIGRYIVSSVGKY